MPPVAEEVARVRSLAARTAAAREWPAEQIEAAEHIADRLGRYAAAIVNRDASVPSCGMAGCPLEHHSAAPAAVRLAVLLARAQGLSRAAVRANGNGQRTSERPNAAETGGPDGGDSRPAQSSTASDGQEPGGLEPQRLLQLHRRYVSALLDAAAVVYCCRRVLHTNGQCFFDASGPRSGLCGRVLAVSHQLELNPLAAS